MSIKIMSAVWDSAIVGSTRRFVLLALADNANDDGECWPSIATIARKTGLCERAVQSAIRDLEAAGVLSVDANAGRKGANKYRLTTALNAPRTTCTPAPYAPTPRTTCTHTPAPNAPEPSFNHQEPSYPPTPQGGPEEKKRFARLGRRQTEQETIAAAMEILRKKDEAKARSTQ